MESTGLFILTWKDDFLAWRDINYSSFYTNFLPRIPVSYIWAPTITLDNSASESQNYKLANDSSVEVIPNGNIAAQMSAKFFSTCEMDIKKYAN